ncbi:MAG: sugar kinase [Marmoricola sp.]|nr:sugar kinase [Marmoricola sp.]
MPVLLALDYGTEGVRAAAYDTEGTCLAESSARYATTFTAPGRAEQDPDDWWAATKDAVRQVVGSDSVRAAGTVVSIGLATTASTVVVLGADGRPLRPAVLWMDARATEESALTAAAAPDHDVLRWSGGSDAVEWLVPKAMWLARHEPTTYAAATRIVECVDYLTWRLTGRWVASRMNAVCKSNFLPATGSYAHALFADLGIPDLAEKLPGTVCAVGDPAGVVTAAVADELGLAARPVVATGGIDAHVSLLGCGGHVPGTVSLVGGTSTVFVTEIEEPIFAPTIWGPYPDALTSGRYLVEGGQVSSGSALTWLSERIFGVGRTQSPALVAEAAAVPPVGHGLVALDYFMGNRTPYRDARLRGAFAGLSLSTTRGEIYRATVEAIAYGTRSVLDSWTSVGVPVERLIASGGIRHNPLWLQVTCDVLGRPIEVVGTDNLTLRSAAAQASHAAGLHPDLWTAAAAYSPETRVVEPDTCLTEDYQRGYERYVETTLLLTSTFHDLSAVRPVGAGEPLGTGRP